MLSRKPRGKEREPRGKEREPRERERECSRIKERRVAAIREET